MENDYQTPMKSQAGGDGASTIAHGLTDTRGMAQSKLEHSEQSNSKKAHQDKRLDEIQAEIQEIGQRLRVLHLEMSQNPDKYSEQQLHKQNERNDLRKRIIDLDFQHKTIISERIRQNKKLEEQKREEIRRQIEEKQRIRKEQMQERERKRKEEMDRYEQEYREKLRRSTELKRKEQPEQVSEKPSEENQQEQSQEQRKTENATNEVIEDELARSRRRVRIAEIEAQLAESRLQRSRIASLNAELDYLRLSYTDPYYVYRPYLLPSYYYPYSAAPIYSRWWYY